MTFRIVNRIIYDESVPAVVTAATPTTDDIAITNVVTTNSIDLPCIQVVAVVEPETVFVSILNDAAFGPV